MPKKATKNNKTNNRIGNTWKRKVDNAYNLETGIQKIMENVKDSTLVFYPIPTLFQNA